MMACFHLLFSPQGSPLLGLSSMAATCHADVSGCTPASRSTAVKRYQQGSEQVPHQHITCD
jgi:hypothetical protein